MSSRIAQMGAVSVMSAELGKEAFESAPIWYEIYDPSDVEIIRPLADSDDWVERHVVQPIKRRQNEHHYYACDNTALIPGRMYTHVAGDIRVLETLFSGFAVFVDSELSSVELFHTEMILLSRSDVLALENYDASQKLGLAIDEHSSLKACFRARHDVVGVPSVKFQIPIDKR